MPNVHLKRVEQGIAALREKQESSPEIAEAFDDIVGAVRAVERRLAVLEGQERARR